MYYIFQVDLYYEDDSFAYLEEYPLDSDGTSIYWDTGLSMLLQKKMNQLSTKTSEDYGKKVKDVFPNSFGGLILNEKCIDLLMSAGVNNLELFPITITCSDSDKKDDSYKMCNILGIISCADMEKSKFYKSSSDPNEIYFINLVLDEGKIKDANDKLNEKDVLKMFLLKEDPSILIIHEDIKNSIEQSDISGIRIVSPQEYHM